MQINILYQRKESGRLPLTVTGIGKDHHQGAFATVRGMDTYFWYLCRSGSGEVILNGQRSVVTKDFGFLIYPGETYSLKPLTEDWTFSYVQFAGDAVSEILFALGFSDSGVYHFFSGNTFQQHVEKFFRLYEQEKGGSQENYSKICYSFLVDLPESIRHIERKNLPADSVLENRTVREILDYLETHFTEDISLDDLSVHVGLTKRYMCTLFKRVMNRTIITELTYIRMGRARVLLRQYPEKRIGEIAALCGYQNAGYFGKVFLKITGETPDGYRRKKQIKN